MPRRRILTSLVVTTWSTLATFCAAQAPERLPPPARPEQPAVKELPATPLPVVMEPGCGPQSVMMGLKQQTFPLVNMKLVEQQELTTVPDWQLREIRTRIPVTDFRIEYKEEKRSTTFMDIKEREEEQLVTSMSSVPEEGIDCHGCKTITYRQVPICKTVKVKVYDTVPVTRDYIVKVPVITPVEGAVEVMKLAIVPKTAPAIVTTFRAVESRGEVTAPVPACPLPPPLHPACPGCQH